MLGLVRYDAAWSGYVLFCPARSGGVLQCGAGYCEVMKKQKAPEFSDQEFDAANVRIENLFGDVSDEELRSRANAQAIEWLKEQERRRKRREQTRANRLARPGAV